MSEYTCPHKFDGWQTCWCPFPADNSNKELWVDGIKYIKCHKKLAEDHLDILIAQGFKLLDILDDPSIRKGIKK